MIEDYKRTLACGGRCPVCGIELFDEIRYASGYCSRCEEWYNLN